MSPDRSPEAERLLMRIRASAGPAPGVDRQVLARVEQRIALEAGALDSGTSGPVPRARATAAGGAAVGGAAVAFLTGPSRWQVASRAAVTLGRWGAFGIVAGAIGYYFGSTEHDRAPSEAATPAEPMVTAPVVSAAIVAAPVVAVPREPARPALVASDTVPEVSAPDVSASDVSVPDIVSGLGEPTPPNEAAAMAAVPSRPFKSSRTAHRAVGAERRAHRATAATAASPGEPTLSLAEVLERLLRAQAKLRDGDPHATLAELDALDELDRGDSGALLEERLVARALAFCDIGRVGDARHFLSELERLGADSIYRGRLEQGCSAALEP
jgi:hypothetical protein